MNDVTHRLSSYRECVRHLWNMHYLALLPTSPDRWELRDQFDDVCCSLFGALVVEPLGLAPVADATRILSPERESSPQILRWLHVVPSADGGVPIMINRDPTAGSGYWDHPIDRVGPSDVDLRLVRWFDFDQLAFRDFKYYFARVESSRHDDLVGRAALIDCEYARVLLEEDAFNRADQVP
jgi:hypothetical protein